MKTNERAIRVLAFVAVIGLFTYWSMFHSHKLREFIESERGSKSAITAHLKAEAEKLNAYLPANVDEHTIAVYASVRDTTMQYHYLLPAKHLTNLSLAERFALERELKSKLASTVCAAESTLNILALGASLRYVYFDDNNIQLAAVEFPPDACDMKG